MSHSADPRLCSILEARDLKELNNQLTEVMKQQQIQSLIRGDNLKKVVDAILALSLNAHTELKLFAAASLGRLAAVARGRESEVFSRASELFSCEPPSIESLADGDEKEYAARILAHVDASWLSAYCAREALTIDTANNARKVLLRALISRTGNIADSIRHLAQDESFRYSTELVESKVKRVRRIFEGLSDVARTYEGEVGREPGSALAALCDTYLRGASNADADARHASFDAAISILVRIIELRFSHALHAETYQVLQVGKKLINASQWIDYLQSSEMIPKVQVILLETSLVLARQNRTDKEILRVMDSCWHSTTSLSEAIRRHFKSAVDINPDIADYWLKVGRVAQSERIAEHKLGNTEDQQIGELLIQLDANRNNMNKLNRAVVPVLETFDPLQAATVRRAAYGYESIVQVALSLARMRKLSKTDLLGSIVEYNPIEHEMEGGHRVGVRKVKVVRDGILKEFGGKKKTLVRPRVEAEE